MKTNSQHMSEVEARSFDFSRVSRIGALFWIVAGFFVSSSASAGSPELDTSPRTEILLISTEEDPGRWAICLSSIEAHPVQASCFHPLVASPEQDELPEEAGLFRASLRNWAEEWEKELEEIQTSNDRLVWEFRRVEIPSNRRLGGQGNALFEDQIRALLHLDSEEPIGIGATGRIYSHEELERYEELENFWLEQASSASSHWPPRRLGISKGEQGDSAAFGPAQVIASWTFLILVVLLDLVLVLLSVSRIAAKVRPIADPSDQVCQAISTLDRWLRDNGEVQILKKSNDPLLHKIDILLHRIDCVKDELRQILGSEEAGLASLHSTLSPWTTLLARNGLTLTEALTELEKLWQRYGIDSDDLGGQKANPTGWRNLASSISKRLEKVEHLERLDNSLSQWIGLEPHEQIELECLEGFLRIGTALATGSSEAARPLLQKKTENLKQLKSTIDELAEDLGDIETAAFEVVSRVRSNCSDLETQNKRLSLQLKENEEEREGLVQELEQAKEALREESVNEENIAAGIGSLGAERSGAQQHLGRWISARGVNLSGQAEELSQRLSSLLRQCPSEGGAPQEVNWFPVLCGQLQTALEAQAAERETAQILGLSLASERVGEILLREQSLPHGPLRLALSCCLNHISPPEGSGDSEEAILFRALYLEEIKAEAGQFLEGLSQWRTNSDLLDKGIREALTKGWLDRLLRARLVLDFYYPRLGSNSTFSAVSFLAGTFRWALAALCMPPKSIQLLRPCPPHMRGQRDQSSLTALKTIREEAIQKAEHERDFVVDVEKFFLHNHENEDRGKVILYHPGEWDASRSRSS